MWGGRSFCPSFATATPNSSVSTKRKRRKRAALEAGFPKFSRPKPQRRTPSRCQGHAGGQRHQPRSGAAFPSKGQKIQTLINFHPGQRMSRVPCQNEGMKMILSLWKRLVQPPQTINQFGSARLVNTAANTRFWAVRRMTRPLPGNGLQCLARRLCFKRKPPKLRPTLIFYGLSIQPSRQHPAGVKTQF